MSLGRIIILFLILAFLGVGIYDLIARKLTIKDDLNQLSAELVSVEKENKELKEKMEYFSHSENLMKELRSKFNYKENGEKLIILVPSASSSER